MSSNSSVSDFDLIYDEIEKFLTQYPSNNIYLGFSGGLDSSVLLHALVSSQSFNNTQNNVICLHVNHGLQAQADSWQQQCLGVAEQLGLEAVALQVQLESTNRKGIEGAARKARYQAMFEFINLRAQESEHVSNMNNSAILLTAHHQRDQAETLLLNLFRGSGVYGLAAMPECKEISLSSPPGSLGIRHGRPLLRVPYQLLKQYADYYQLEYVEDPSNADNAFRRNFIRNELLPQIETFWPQSKKLIAQAADNVQESVELLELHAEKTLQQYEYSTDFIGLKSFAESPWLEQKSVIRYWFKRFFPETVLQSAHYDWLESVVAKGCKSENDNFSYKLKEGVLRIYSSRLYYLTDEVVGTREGVTTARSVALMTFFNDQVESQVVNFQQQMSFSIGSNILNNTLFIRKVSVADSVDKKTLKRFFQNEKIPVWQRKSWPVLVDESNNLVSVLGCPKCLLKAGDVNNKDCQIDVIEVDYLLRQKMIEEIK